MKSKKVDQFVLETLQNSGIEGENLTKHLIIWKSFYNEVKPFIKKMSALDQCWFAGKFLIFVMQYETIVVKACKPLSGSLNVARDIIHMYSSREVPKEQKKLTLKN